MVAPTFWGPAGPEFPSRVSIDVEQAAAKVVVEQPEGMLDAECAMSGVLAAVDECLRRQDRLRVIFLWLRGGARRPSAPTPALPAWAGNDVAGYSASAEEQLMPAHALKSLLVTIDLLPQPIVGLAEGHINTFGTTLLAACDYIISTRDTQLVFPRVALPEGIHSALAGLQFGAEAARKLGFVSSIAPSAAAMQDESARLHVQLASCHPGNLRLAKQRMRDARLATLRPARATPQLPPPPQLQPQAPRPPQPQPQAPQPQQQQQQQQQQQPLQQPQQPQHGAPSKATRLSALSDQCLAARESAPAAPLVRAPPGLPPPVANTEAAEAREPGKPRRGGPKKTDLLLAYSSYEGPLTSLMICNIPCRITQEQLIDAVDSMGFGDKYNFLYLPTGCRSSGSTTVASSNLGYGFVNFVSAQEAARFSEAFRDFHFKGSRSAKVCTVRPAHIQGLANNIMHFGRSTGKSKSRSLLVQPVVKVSQETLVQLKELGLGCYEMLQSAVQADTGYAEELPLRLERLHL